MPSVYPGALPPAGSASSTDTLAAAGHTSLHNTDRDGILAVATKVGTGASTPTANQVLRGTGAGTSAWGQVALASEVSGTLPVANGGTGTTTSTGTGSVVLSSSPTIVTPTIASFTNAQHDHTNAAGGGTLGAAAMPNLVLGTQSLSNPYKFSVRRVAAASTGNNDFAKVVWDTEDFDTNNNFATGTYTAPVAGFYLFNAAINVTTNVICIVSLYKNGVEFRRGDQVTTNAGLGLSALLQLAANDTIDIYAYGSGTGTIDVAAGLNYFTGILVSQT